MLSKFIFLAEQPVGNDLVKSRRATAQQSILPVELESFHVIVPTPIRIHFFVVRILVNFTKARFCIVRRLSDTFDCIQVSETILEVVEAASL